MSETKQREKTRESERLNGEATNMRESQSLRKIREHVRTRCCVRDMCADIEPCRKAIWKLRAFVVEIKVGIGEDKKIYNFSIYKSSE